MRKPGQLVLMSAAAAFAVVPLLSQTAPPQTAAANKPSFEVVSVKAAAPAAGGFRGGGPRGNSLTLANVPVRMLVQMAHQRATGTAPGLQMQIVGAPDWMNSELYDIQAKADCSNGPIPREQMQLMIQSLLEERFQFKAHYETRELPVYQLVIVKEGKLKPSDDQTPAAAPLLPPASLCGPIPQLPAPLAAGVRGAPFDPNKPPPLPRGAMRMMMNPTTGATVEATAAPLGTLVNLMQTQAGRPIIDKTGLKGLFDFKVNFSPEGVAATPFGAVLLPPPPPGAAAAGAPPPMNAADPVPSLFTAIQEQLGLKLESTKGPIEVLVIDSIQKPTQN